MFAKRKMDSPVCGKATAALHATGMLPRAAFRILNLSPQNQKDQSFWTGPFGLPNLPQTVRRGRVFAPKVHQRVGATNKGLSTYAVESA